MQPGWPVVLRDGPVLLRPYRRGDAKAWSETRRANEAWLARWEPTPYGSWEELAAGTRPLRAWFREECWQGAAVTSSAQTVLP